MRVLIRAIGRQRAGPEKLLCDDYLSRAGKTGAALSLGPFSLTELEVKRSDSAAESALLAEGVPAGSRLVALDERGILLTSPDFAARLSLWRDDGFRDAAFLIGGADGMTADLRNRADLLLSFGKMVWPHLLVRVMLAEQLYRATTILSGGPYHRA